MKKKVKVTVADQWGVIYRKIERIDKNIEALTEQRRKLPSNFVTYLAGRVEKETGYKATAMRTRFNGDIETYSFKLFEKNPLTEDEIAKCTIAIGVQGKIYIAIGDDLKNVVEFPETIRRFVRRMLNGDYDGNE